MSYYNILDEKQMKEPVKKVRDHRKEKNPHYGCVMSDTSRDAIASKQRLRYELMRSALEQSKNSVSEERVREIIKETIDNYLSRNAAPVKNNIPNIPI